MRSLLSCIVLVLAFHAHAIQLNYTLSPATCGECNGSILVAPAGGTGGYTYFWTPEPASGQGVPQAIGLCPGTYTIEVWDSMGDHVGVAIEVPALPGLNMTGALASSMVTAACPGQCNGTLTMNDDLLGGTAPYTFITAPAMPLNALCGNTPFDLTITDANGCSGTITTVVPEQQVPHLLYTEVIGPCGAAPTSVVAHFDVLPNFIQIHGPDGAVWPYTITNGGVAISGAIPGVFAISGMALPPCAGGIWHITYPAIITDCATVSGDLFVDIDGDCLRNGTDFGLANRLVEIAPGYATLTNANGQYQRQLPDGTYDLSVSDPAYTQDCPTASPVNFTVDEMTPAVIDIAFTPGADPDVAVSCAFGDAVVGFQQQVWITVTNNSGVPSGPITVTLDHDPVLLYCYFWNCIAPPYSPPVVLPYPTSYAPGQVIWELDGGLGPGATRQLSVQLCVPADVGLLGTQLNFDVSAATALNDYDLGNNTCTHTTTIVGSYDPNDMLARTNSGSSSEWSLENDSLITYTIRFQNTGTAPAVNVVLIDTIQSTLDLSTLKILGASHTYSTSLNDRVLSFTFDHIMLPDSNTNEPGSHGFAQFSIRPVGMSPGSSVENFADIYFDFNPPIRTNTSVVAVPLATAVPSFAAASASVFPNPASTELLIKGNGPWEATIWSADGRLQARYTNITAAVPISGLAPGMYAIHIGGRDGSVTVERFVKE